METTLTTINVGPRKPSSRSSRAYVDSPSPPHRSHSFFDENMENYCSEEEDNIIGGSMSSLDDEEEDYDTVQVIFKKIYTDPLQDLFDSIDSDAANILRTGRLTVHGEAGDMDIIQPLLFGLQPSEADIPILLPQLLQSPFFIQKEESPGSNLTHADNFLKNGYIRLGVIVDQVIYELLSTHCCKGPGARQADTLIETALNTHYTLPSGLLKNPPPLLPKGYTVTQLNIDIPEESDEENEMRSLTVPPTSSKSSKKSSSGVFSSSSSIGNSSIAEEERSYLPDMPALHMRPRADSLKTSRRKESIWTPPVYIDRRLSETSQEAINWYASLPQPKDMIIGSYGDNTYPILMWNPKLKVSFKLGTKLHDLSNMAAIVENPKDLLILKIVNTTEHKVAFSIRAHRQSMAYRSYVIYPKAGLHMLEPKQDWTFEVELMSGNQTRDEHFCIDLLVCAFNCKPSWNVHRRYAVIKQSQDQHKIVKKISRGGLILPGSGQQKDIGNSLRQVILHGLQSVVKNKLDEAEIIFTHAVHLPLFQRAPLKAFAYICLAVVANKRRKKATFTDKVGHVLKLVNSMDKLTEACESAPSMRMPKMIALVKQLKKELNPAKVIKEYKKPSKTQISAVKNEITKEVPVSGDDGMSLNNISLLIPDGALPQSAKVTLSHFNQDEIHQSIQSSPWASMLSILTAVCVQCSPPVEQFIIPVVITITLPSDMKIPEKSTSLRLLQSNYMSSWMDITDEPATDISISHSDRQLTVKTDHSGWFVVAVLQLDISRIIPMAVKSVFSEESILLHVNAFGYIFPDRTHAQVSVFVSPQVDHSSISVDPPPGHKLIAFPHSFKANKGQKIRLELQGKFDPDVEGGQTDLYSELSVDGIIEGIVEKTVTLSPGANGLYGKLIISTYCTSHKAWEPIQEMNLSSATDTHQNNNKL